MVQCTPGFSSTPTERERERETSRHTHTHTQSNLIYRVTVVQYAGVVKPEMPVCVYLLCYK